MAWLMQRVSADLGVVPAPAPGTCIMGSAHNTGYVMLTVGRTIGLASTDSAAGLALTEQLHLARRDELTQLCIDGVIEWWRI